MQFTSHKKFISVFIHDHQRQGSPTRHSEKEDEEKNIKNYSNVVFVCCTTTIIISADVKNFACG